MSIHRLSSKSMTVLVETNSYGKIVKVAPVVRRFIGQQLSALESWMRKQGDFERCLIGKGKQ